MERKVWLTERVKRNKVIVAEKKSNKVPKCGCVVLSFSQKKDTTKGRCISLQLGLLS